MNGTYKAKATEWQFGSINEKERIEVVFQVIGGEHEGKSLTWHGYFTEKAIDRTFDSLRHCGWDSDSILELDNLGANEVEIVVEEEQFKNDRGETKTTTKVQWVNRAQKLSVKNQMSEAAKAVFANKMRGPALAHNKKYGAQPAAQSRPQQQQQRRSPASGGADRDGYDGPPPDDNDYA